MSITDRVGRRLASCATMLLLVLPQSARGSTGLDALDAADCSRRAESGATGRWGAPMDRVITVFARDVSLRDALDRVAAASHLRISYSAETVPVDRRVCLPSTPITVGDALGRILRGTTADPIVMGSDQIVLAPSPTKRVEVDTAISRASETLERVVVTGSAVGTAQRPLTVALDVVSGQDIARTSNGSLSQFINASVPGLWIWSQSPSSLLARYGSIRGASSFGLSYPKIYIDGIEVANPLLITQIDPAILDHVEVIRGPQGAALYGADAISGVVNIVTRNDAPSSPDERLRVNSAGGFATSSFAAHPVLVQEHSLSFRTGSNLRSGGLAIAGSTVGDYTPEAASHELRASGGFRMIGAQSTLAMTGRLYAKSAGVAPNPLLVGFGPPQPPDTMMGQRRSMSGGPPPPSRDNMPYARPVANESPQSVRQYTLGMTGSRVQSERWTHTVVAGLDGYHLSNLPNDFTPVPSAADSALRAARGEADRGTLRANAVGSFGAPGTTSATVTVAVEEAVLREKVVSGEWRGGPGPQLAPVVSWRNNTGAVTQVNASLDNTFFVTSGLRVERNGGVSKPTTATLPMVGAAWVADRGGVAIKLRGAYGAGSRPPTSATRATTWLGVHTAEQQMGAATATPDLGPERQTGTEFGIDVLGGQRFGAHLTRFDQRAFGLIQPVAVATNTSTTGPAYHQLAYRLQNVGEITNRGWEAQSSLNFSSLSINGAFSTVDSRVAKVAAGYAGDLAAGDRVLAVPAWTAGLTATWTAARWSTSLGVARAGDWINYDRLALASASVDGGHRPNDLVGVRLREYWRAYDGVTRLSANFSRDLFRRASLTINGSNLLNGQRDEPDNVTILPGRTITMGLRAKF